MKLWYAYGKRIKEAIETAETKFDMKLMRDEMTMGKAPPNLPAVNDKARLRGRPSLTGIVKFINAENHWARVTWDHEGHGPRLCHLYELEKIDDPV